MLTLHFRCPSCGFELHLGLYRVRPLMVCPNCVSVFRVSAYGKARLDVGPVRKIDRACMFWCRGRN